MICLKHATLRELIDLKLPLETKVYWVDIYDYEKDYTKLYLEYIELAAKIFDIKKDSLLSKTRTADVVEVRNMIWCILNKIHNVPTNKIGKLAYKNHATVMHGIKTTIDRMSVDKEFKKKYDVFINSVNKEINETYNYKFK